MVVTGGLTWFAILSPAGDNVGIGFAVPINMAYRVEQIVLN
jgi:S1-C subfamily serine protease